MSTALDVLLFGAETGPGRGENPGDAGGVLIIIGIVLLVLAAVVLAGVIVARRRPARPDSESRPHRRGRVGRV
jgi:flagellar basal body-associated protein FliL